MASVQTKLVLLGKSLYNLVDEQGVVLIANESYTICSDIQFRLAHPKRWCASETQEIADSIRISMT